MKTDEGSARMADKYSAMARSWSWLSSAWCPRRKWEWAKGSGGAGGLGGWGADAAGPGSPPEIPADGTVAQAPTTRGTARAARHPGRPRRRDAVLRVTLPVIMGPLASAELREGSAPR